MADTRETGAKHVISQIRAEANEIIGAAVPVMDNPGKGDVNRELFSPSSARLRARQNFAYNGGASVVDRVDKMGL